ncbi:hypothetical protein DFQ30_002198, partial [Apophysomyces sp. BC1015]
GVLLAKAKSRVDSVQMSMFLVVSSVLALKPVWMLKLKLLPRVGSMLASMAET